MKHQYIRRPKRVTRRGGSFTDANDFVRAAKNSISTSQDVVQRIGNAIIGGDFSGNARGEYAIDIQVTRSNPGDVASGVGSVVFATSGRAAGNYSVAVGDGVSVDSNYGLALGASSQVTETALRGVAIGYAAISEANDEAVIAGTALKLQTSIGTKKLVLTEANFPTYLDGTYVKVSGDTMTGALMLDGSADTVQLRVQGHSTQTSNIFTIENSSATVLAKVAVGSTGRPLFSIGDAVSDANNNPTFQINSTNPAGFSNLIFEAISNNAANVLFFPAGTGTTAQFGFFNANSATNAAAGARARHVIGITSTEAFIRAGQGLNGGTNLPLNLYTYATTFILNQTAASQALVVKAASSQSANLMEWQNSGATVQLAIASNARDLILDTTTGTKIGTSSSQKLSLWNATPIVQPTTGSGSASFTANAGTAVNDASTFDGYTIKQVVKALRDIGALA